MPRAHCIECGDALAGIVIPPDYATLLHQRKTSEVMVAVGASDATAAHAPGVARL